MKFVPKTREIQREKVEKKMCQRHEKARKKRDEKNVSKTREIQREKVEKKMCLRH